MPAKARLVLGTTALCALVLLPFIVRFLEVESAPRRHAGTGGVAQLIRHRQYTDAYDLLRRSPGDSLARSPLHQYRLAVCERSLGLTDSAYTRLLRLEGTVPLLEDHRRLWLARSLEALADSQAAVDGYRRLLDDDPVPTVADSARLYLAALLRDGGDLAGALTVYRSQLRSSGSTPRLLYDIARVRRRLGEEAGARATELELMDSHPGHRLALDVARRLQTHTWEERFARAQVYYRHRDDRRAIDDLRYLLRVNPGHSSAPSVMYILGRAYARSGQLARARHTFERLYREHGWPSALYRLAGLEVRGGHDLDAADAYVDFAGRYPNHELADDALWQAAKAAERQDAFARAGRIYARLAQDHPGSDYAEDAAWGVGFSDYCLGQDEAALAQFVAVAGHARQPHIVDQSLFWAGKTAARLGRAEAAHRYFDEAADGFPRSYYSSRAVSLGYGTAAPALTTALRPPLDGTGLDLHGVRDADYVRRAMLLGDLGLSSAAEAELRQAEAANRGDSDALMVLRDGYDILGLHDRALALSTRAAPAGQALERLYPSYYWDEVADAARDADVDPYLVLSVIRQESYFNEDAVSHAGAMGLMQIMPQTGRRLASHLGVRSFKRRSLFDPQVSIRLGTRFLGDQVRAFASGPARGLEFPLGLAAYNAGPQVARRWIERFPIDDADTFVERIPYAETRLYVKKVLKNYTIYKTLKGRQSRRVTLVLRTRVRMAPSSWRRDLYGRTPT